jgi:hypothetical protein
MLAIDRPSTAHLYRALTPRGRAFRIFDLTARARGALWRHCVHPCPFELLKTEHALREALQILETLKEDN